MWSSQAAPTLGAAICGPGLIVFRAQYDEFRTATICEPRGSEVVVGALLCEPSDPSAAAAVIFYNDVGYLGMCGHGTIGVVTTLAHLGRIGPGEHTIETPVGLVTTHLRADGSVSLGMFPATAIGRMCPSKFPVTAAFVAISHGVEIGSSLSRTTDFRCESKIAPSFWRFRQRFALL